jgi:hypothetical protein
VSADNVDLHRKIYGAFNAHSADELVALCDPTVVIHSVFGAVTGAVYRGHDGVRQWQRDLEEAWGNEIRVAVETYFDLGEHTIAFDVLHGRGRGSGAVVALPGAAVARWSSARCTYFRAYADRDAPLADLGVERDALNPVVP